MKKPINVRIHETREKLKQLEARAQQIEARRRTAEAKAERAKETRRKILAGVWLNEAIKHDPELKTRMLEGIDGSLKRSDERALFGLQPRD